MRDDLAIHLAASRLLAVQSDHSLMMTREERPAWIASEERKLATRSWAPALVVEREPDLVVGVYLPLPLGKVLLLRYLPESLRGLPLELEVGSRLLAVLPGGVGLPAPAPDLFPHDEQLRSPVSPRIAQLLVEDPGSLRPHLESLPEEWWTRAEEQVPRAYRESAYQPRDGRPLHAGVVALRASHLGPDKSPFRSGEWVGPYRLCERLGRGSMGEVWRARRRGAPEPAAEGGEDDVAIKLPLRPSFVRHLRQEGLLLAAVDHPNVARFVEADLECEAPYLVTELVAGQPLRALCRGTISSAAATLLCDQLLAGLRAIHEAGVLHLDLKPENVIVQPDGQLKIVDLGLGQATTRFMEEVYLSVSLASREPPVAGTLAYMSPEQRRGRELDPRTDLFAFGILLHELLAGVLPEPGRRLTELRPELLPRWDVAVARLTHPEREQRPRDANEARIMVSYSLSKKHLIPVARGGVRPRHLASYDEEAFALVSPYLAGMVIGAGYELVQPLGRGGFGEVWRARRGEELVALKLVLASEARAGLEREAEVAGRLSHAGIPALRGDHSAEEPPHLVFDLVEGRSLRLILNEALEEGKKLPLQRALSVFAGQLEVVAACAEAEVVHMDLKPEHFLVDEGSPEQAPRVSLIDFGLAALSEGRRGAEGSLATRAEVRGTLDYMAPEQRQGEVSPAVDVYALGVCLFELLTLSLPRGPQRARAIRRDVPPRLDELITRMLASDPRRRPSLGEVRATLADAEGDAALAGRPRRQPAPSGLAQWVWELRQLARWTLATPLAYPFVVFLILGIVALPNLVGRRAIPSHPVTGQASSGRGRAAPLGSASAAPQTSAALARLARQLRQATTPDDFLSAWLELRELEGGQVVLVDALERGSQLVRSYLSELADASLAPALAARLQRPEPPSAAQVRLAARLLSPAQRRAVYRRGGGGAVSLAGQVLARERDERSYQLLLLALGERSPALRGGARRHFEGLAPAHHLAGLRPGALSSLEAALAVGDPAVEGALLGALSALPAAELSALGLRETLTRLSLDPARGEEQRALALTLLGRLSE